MPELTDLTRLVRTKVHLCGCGCWVWTGSVDSSGYAKMKMKNRTIPVHIYVFEFFYGPQPDDDDWTIDHLCDRHRNCVNPEHMESVLRGENSRRANYRRWHAEAPDRTACTITNNKEKKSP